MGLTTWENAPSGKIVRTDVAVAKNYLSAKELESLGLLVSAVLDLAERMAKRHVPMTMEDWAKRIDLILEADGDRILQDAGSISTEFAREFAEAEFEKYRVVQDRLFASDFDRFGLEGGPLPELPFEGGGCFGVGWHFTRVTRGGANFRTVVGGPRVFECCCIVRKVYVILALDSENA